MLYKIKDQRSRALSISIYLKIVIKTCSNKNYGDWIVENKVLDIWQILDILNLGCEILMTSAANGVRDYNKNL